MSNSIEQMNRLGFTAWASNVIADFLESHGERLGKDCNSITIEKVDGTAILHRKNTDLTILNCFFNKFTGAFPGRNPLMLTVFCNSITLSSIFLSISCFLTKTFRLVFKPLDSDTVTFIFYMVREKGLEPSHLSIPVPKTGVSTVPPLPL